jgi:Protein kinase domain
VEGTPFGRYQLIELLGRGGMGEVWRAHDTAIDRTVAVKMLLPHFAKDPEFEKRFRREARAAARLDDPHVVPMHDVGEIDGRLYVTMRLINGVDLQTMLNTGPLDAPPAVHIVEQIASALHSAHQAGLVIAVGHMVTPPPRPSVDRDTVPTAMDQVIATGLANQPTDRYPSTVEMAAAAQRAITEPINRPGAIQQAPPVWVDPAQTQPWQSSSAAPTAPAHFGPPAGPFPPPPVPPGGKRTGRRIGD